MHLLTRLRLGYTCTSSNSHAPCITWSHMQTCSFLPIHTHTDVCVESQTEPDAFSKQVTLGWILIRWNHLLCQCLRFYGTGRPLTRISPHGLYTWPKTTRSLHKLNCTKTAIVFPVIKKKHRPLFQPFKIFLLLYCIFLIHLLWLG